MSSRFGRNKRRRAREELAAQVQLTADHQNLAQQYRSKFEYERQSNEHLRVFFVQVAKRVGREAFIACGTADIEMEPGFARPVNVRISDPMMASYTFGGLGSVPQFHRVAHEVLHRLDISAVADPFRAELAFQAHINGKAAGIALSETLLRRASKAELLHVIRESLAPQLAEHLVTALKGR